MLNVEIKIDHSMMVRVLAKSGEQIRAELTTEQAHALHMAVGISGESGELLDAVKKGAIYQKPFDRENIIEELGDLEFYMEGLRQGFGITREETLVANIRKLGKRYNNFVYSNNAAQQRADKTSIFVAEELGAINAELNAELEKGELTK